MVIASALCCASSVCCNALCCGLKSCGLPAKTYPKATYVVLDVLFMVGSIIAMVICKPLFEKFEWECNESSGGGTDCIGVSMIIRASFSLTMLHLLILIFICPRVQCSSFFHDGLWCLKGLMLIGIYVGSFWLSNEFFEAWA